MVSFIKVLKISYAHEWTFEHKHYCFWSSDQKFDLTKVL